MVRFVDSHAHLTSTELVGDAEAALERARAASVCRIVNICTDRASLAAGLALAEQHPEVVLTAATTPHDVATEGEAFFPLVEEQVRRGALVAIGETGLDYHYEHSPRAVQQEFLRRYLQLAHRAQLPVVIHCRDAFEDFFRILDERFVKGVLHCFTGTEGEAEEVVARGWYLSLSGIVTFKRSEGLRRVAKAVPLEQLLIETDSPYLAPQRHRGKRNEPAFVREVAETIAAVKGVSLEEVARVTGSNACHLFGLEFSA